MKVVKDMVSVLAMVVSLGWLVMLCGMVGYGWAGLVRGIGVVVLTLIVTGVIDNYRRNNDEGGI